jgi:hypothetical protein
MNSPKKERNKEKRMNAFCSKKKYEIHTELESSNFTARDYLRYLDQDGRTMNWI